MSICALLSEMLVQMFSDVIVFLCKFQIYFDFYTKLSHKFQLAHSRICITSTTGLKYYTHSDTPPSLQECTHYQQPPHPPTQTHSPRMTASNSEEQGWTSILFPQNLASNEQIHCTLLWT